MKVTGSALWHCDGDPLMAEYLPDSTEHQASYFLNQQMLHCDAQSIRSQATPMTSILLQ